MHVTATVVSSDAVAAQVLLAVVVIVLAARVAGALLERLGQPAVIGELIAGIALGPTLLGALPGHLPELLFPHDVRPLLSAIGNLGLVLFMFLLGLELDASRLRRRPRAAATIALSSVAVPFGLGILLALALHPATASTGHHAGAFLPLALFVGTAVSVTAFPVLARILVDTGLQRTELGGLALTCAAMQDALAWVLLGIALAVAGATGLGDLARIPLEMLAFLAVVWLVVRPLLGRFAAQRARPAGASPALLTIAIAGAALSAYVTGAIGLHFVLGAFVFGAAFPRGHGLRADLDAKLTPLTTAALLPIFFAVPGLGVNLRAIEPDGLLALSLIFAVACAGKLVGATAAARAVGIRWREAVALGTLMNTRGLMELIVLNIGLAAGILDTRLYGLFVVMAVATTLMTAPLLRALYRDRSVPEHLAVAAPARRAPHSGVAVASAAALEGAQAGLLAPLHGRLGARAQKRATAGTRPCGGG
ncbi:MAG: hypothetical protein QOG42_1006 [Solirubrobacteraceae bacterium]|jgi:Kef-type K+ transport system membrane component KefB|nr:hypothetical protein [Solirubrobacteraceae bacterium]